MIKISNTCASKVPAVDANSAINGLSKKILLIKDCKIGLTRTRIFFMFSAARFFSLT